MKHHTILFLCTVSFAVFAVGAATLDVTQFGAKLDGATDNTSAIQPPRHVLHGKEFKDLLPNTTGFEFSNVGVKCGKGR